MFPPLSCRELRRGLFRKAFRLRLFVWYLFPRRESWPPFCLRSLPDRLSQALRLHFQELSGLRPRRPPSLCSLSLLRLQSQGISCHLQAFPPLPRHIRVQGLFPLLEP